VFQDFTAPGTSRLEIHTAERNGEKKTTSEKIEDENFLIKLSHEISEPTSQL
jgi:hypothetical protein